MEDASEVGFTKVGMGQNRHTIGEYTNPLNTGWWFGTFFMFPMLLVYQI